VVVDPEVEEWRVGVDKRRFERVLVNLMENADHYGGGVTTIAVAPGSGPGTAPSTPGRLVEVTVDDAGPGIDPAERTKVFERFYRGSASGRRGTGTGTGLGLALVAEHMHVMRGDVRVESSPDGGARFVLSLPVLSNDDGDGVEDTGDELVAETGVEA
jgi:signal transduction histidine kinase